MLLLGVAATPILDYASLPVRLLALLSDKSASLLLPALFTLASPSSRPASTANRGRREPTLSLRGRPPVLRRYQPKSHPLLRRPYPYLPPSLRRGIRPSIPRPTF